MNPFQRIVSISLTADSAASEQAFSADGGKAWKTNWINTHTFPISQANLMKHAKRTSNDRLQLAYSLVSLLRVDAAITENQSASGRRFQAAK
jgi:hypothetical protein